MIPQLTTIRPNLNVLEYGTLKVWFSYQTPIAFETSRVFAVRENDWSTTTGKHLNEVSGGRLEGRIPGPEFEARLKQVWPAPII